MSWTTAAIQLGNDYILTPLSKVKPFANETWNLVFQIGMSALGFAATVAGMIFSYVKFKKKAKVADNSTQSREPVSTHLEKLQETLENAADKQHEQQENEAPDLLALLKEAADKQELTELAKVLEQIENSDELAKALNEQLKQRENVQARPVRPYIPQKERLKDLEEEKSGSESEKDNSQEEYSPVQRTTPPSSPNIH